MTKDTKEKIIGYIGYITETVGDVKEKPHLRLAVISHTYLRFRRFKGVFQKEIGKILDEMMEW